MPIINSNLEFIQSIPYHNDPKWGLFNGYLFQLQLFNFKSMIKLRINKLILVVNFFFLFLTNNIFAQQSDVEDISSEPGIYPTVIWGAIQLIPSPQWITSSDGLKFGMRWQVTPLLYSFGINKKLSPWRYLISEPLVRQSGSVELFFTPEYLNLSSEFNDKWLFRGGARVYLPFWQKGEYMSASLAASYYNFNGTNGVSYEAGLYFFAGILGIQTTYSPTFTNSEWIFTIRLRYF